jgi:hypothetical protein
MNPRSALTFKMLVAAAMVSLTAACSAARAVFAPGMVAEAKSPAIAGGNQVALVPGSVDQGSTRQDPRPAFNGALVPGGADLARTSAAPPMMASTARIPGSVDLAVRGPDPQPYYAGALIPGSRDLGRASGSPSTTYNGALVPGSVDQSITH